MEQFNAVTAVQEATTEEVAHSAKSMLNKTLTVTKPE